MATSLAGAGLPPATLAAEDPNDPFVNNDNSPVDREPRHRYSTFDSHLFALGPNASPAQAKRALEAHLAETDRRMEEAGKLGTALVQQRKELTQRLEEVDKLQAEGQLSQDLKDKLVEIEKDYNDVARESARAFLPKPRVPSNEAAGGSPFVPEGKGGRRSVSPSKFEAQATGSPTKLSVPNRKLRNQPTNRIHDIEFAAEISQSLIVQVRNLQALLAEREEELRDIKLEKSKLEYDTEGFQQRVKTLDESQNKYKDENWSLETQVHELLASQRESADREKKLQQAVSILQAEKTTAQRELDEVKLSHSKLTEDHAAAVRHHDTELGAAKRNMVMADSEKSALIRKIEDLTGQNQELAKAVSSQRGRTSDRQDFLGTSDDEFETANDHDTPEHSPPPSPVKGTPRHSLLESETLKTSLQHAQRTIQSLRTNVHREKTEKLELRRMLQDARDELEKTRTDPMAGQKRSSKTSSREFKKPPRLLGGLRSARSEIFADDPEWEDSAAVSGPGHPNLSQRGSSSFATVIESTEHEDFETANDTSDQAFETANERGTETDDFHTGAEEFSNDDDVQTETDSPTKRRTLRGRPPSLPMGLTRSGSVRSTASTGDEYSFEETSTPTSQLPSLQHKFPLRVGRAVFRRSRQASEDPTFQSSPVTSANSVGGTPQPVQSLAAELGDFDGSDNESNLSATPSRRSVHLSRPGSIRGTTASPPPPVPQLPRVIMVDSGTMTDPESELRGFSAAGTQGPARPQSMNTVVSGFSDYSDQGTLDMDENLARFPSPPTSPPQNHFPSSDVDAHNAELEALRREHAERIERLQTEHAGSHAAALSALESSHADKLTKAAEEARVAHARELDDLKSGYDEKTGKAAAEATAAHAAALAALESSHSDDLKRALQEAKSTHVRELEIFQAEHTAGKDRAVADAVNAHEEELRTLRTSHSEELGQLASEHEAKLASQRETLKASHAEELHRSKKFNDEAHATELASLVAAHSAQIELVKKELDESHAKELDSLKHALNGEFERAQQDTDAAHAKKLEDLRTTHLVQIEEAKHSLSDTHQRELDALKAAHATQVEHTSTENKAVHAAAIAALAATHSKALETSKIDGDATLAKELDSLRSAHQRQLDANKTEADDRLARELDSLKVLHKDQLETSRAEIERSSAADLERLKSEHAGVLSASKADHEVLLAKEVESLRVSHAKQLEEYMRDAEGTLTRELATVRDAHAQQLEKVSKEKDAAATAEITALQTLHSKQLAASKADAEDNLARALSSLKESHARELETLRSEHLATHAKELDSFKAALAKQLESSRSEGDAAHSEQLAALNAANVEIVEAHKRDSAKALEQALDSAKASHERDIEALRNELGTARSNDMAKLSADHDEELKAVRADLETAKVKAVEDLTAQHGQYVTTLQTTHTASKSKELAELASNYEQQLDALKVETTAAKLKEIEELKASHLHDLKSLQADAEALKIKELADLESKHKNEIHILHTDASSARAKDLDELRSIHATDLSSLQDQHQSALTEREAALVAAHAGEITRLRADHDAAKASELEALTAQHGRAMVSLKGDQDAAHSRDVETLKAQHTELLNSLRAEHESSFAAALGDLKTNHSREIDSLNSSHGVDLEAALVTIKSSHAEELDNLRGENETALAQALDVANGEHAKALEQQRAEHSAERDQLLASHALELQTLRESLTVKPPTLDYSSVNSIIWEPLEEPDNLHTPKRAGFVPAHENYEPHTPSASVIKSLGRKNRDIGIPFIAEDDTRQSPTATTGPETPESQRPFKEMSTNTNVRPGRAENTPTAHQSSQTTLTSDGIDQLLFKTGRRASRESLGTVPFDDGTPATVRHRRSVESIGSPSRSRTRTTDSNTPIQVHVPTRRPSSSGSTRGTQAMLPPLPANHREAIEAARTGSSHGSKGNMGPPLLPASAYKASGSRPRTPRDRPMSPLSVRSTQTARAIGTGSALGYAELQSPTRMTARSRQSSVTSFASEIDSRFNIRGEMGMDAAGFAGPNTDPRMIQAITQTMIGEYLWKYTRKAGRGEMSENRHRRYFWVHPYTRTLYWSDRDPSTAGRSELKAKSVPIKAVRVVADDNHMPPGLHRKSLVIVSPGRTIKFTCTTGQRHETWFNALSYLLLRTGNEGQNDTEEMAGNITQEDVEEFNPSFGRQPTNATRRAPPSLSSYHSRTTRNESPAVGMSMNIPTLTPTHEKGPVRPGTLNRLSGYLKPSGSRTSVSGGFFGSLRSRSQVGHGHGSAIYEASEVNDSAEELRQMIEQQDREADRLENVRACCDGKHDVGTLSRSSKRNRHSHSHSHTHTHPGSTTPTPAGTLGAKV